MNKLALFTPAVLRSLPFDLFDDLMTNSLNESNTSYPYTNIIEENDQYRLELALPGYTKEQISLNYLHNVLTIKSNLDENQKDEKNYITHEFVPGNFNRQFLLPRTLDVEKINAEFKDGVLQVTISKKEEARIKEPIEIQVQ